METGVLAVRPGGLGGAADPERQGRADAVDQGPGEPEDVDPELEARGGADPGQRREQCEGVAVAHSGWPERWVTQP